MEQLELHDGQLAGLSLLAAKGSTSRRRSCNMCGEEFSSHTTGHAGLAAFVARGDICGSMKELGVSDRRCLHLNVLKLTDG